MALTTARGQLLQIRKRENSCALMVPSLGITSQKPNVEQKVIYHLMKTNRNLQTPIAGLRLEQIAIGRGVTKFTFDGRVSGQPIVLEASTHFEVCFDTHDVFQKDIVDDASTVELWACLERLVESVSTSEDGRVCEIRLDNGKTIFVSSKEHQHDNLLVVRHLDSTNWFTIG